MTPKPPAVTCPCKACVGMRKAYGKDPALLEFYGKKLLERGWATGEKPPYESAYVLAHARWAKGLAGRGFKKKGAWAAPGTP